jgi:hypothetical protein
LGICYQVLSGGKPDSKPVIQEAWIIYRTCSTISGLELYWKNQKKGKPKATYKLEEMTPAEKEIIMASGAENAHNERPEIKDIGVYK